jgi:hypothetical protein
MADRDVFMRRALWASALFNCGGALLFAFPASLGQLAGLPVPVPRVYSALVVLFVLLFAWLYAWLARQPRIERPLVGLAAVGKASAFATVLLSYLLGDVSLLAVLAMSGDLLLAAVYAWWLLGAVDHRAIAAHRVS